MDQQNTQIAFAPADPWQPYQNGQKPGPVPEPAEFGAIFIMVTVAAVFLVRRLSRPPR